MSVQAAAAHAFVPVAAAIDAGRIPGAALGLVSRNGDRAGACAGRAAVEPPAMPTWRSSTR